jgi:cytidylate kinase
MIRNERSAKGASQVAALPAVREAAAAPACIPERRAGGRRSRHGHGGFPDAPLKIFLTASAEERPVADTCS